MFENQTKGWHGAFSNIGRNSAEKYHIIIHKDDFMKNRTKAETQQIVVNFLKRNNYSNIENEKDEGAISDNGDNDNQLDAIEDNIDIFQLDNITSNKQKVEKKEKINNKNNRNCKSATHRVNAESYKYHDKHMREGNKKKFDREPTCTKYNPKRDFVWQRTLTGPKWDTIKPRSPLYHTDDTHYYLGLEDPLAHCAKGFISFAKQSARGDFIANSNNVRFAKTKPFTPTNINKRPLSSTSSCFSNEVSSKGASAVKVKAVTNTKKFTHPMSGRPMSVTTNYSSRPMTSNNPTTGRGFNTTTNNYNTSHISSQNGSRENSLSSVSSSSQEDSYEQYKYIYQKQFKKRPMTAVVSAKSSNMLKPGSIASSTKCANGSQTMQKKKKSIKAPDFKKAISREYLDEIADKKSSLIPFSLPNFKQVRERPIMMVVYDRKRHHRKKPKEMKGIEPSMYYDPDKMLNKVNNHTEVHAPKFDIMSSRPDDDNPLPSYMKRVYTRECAYSITDQTLKMNNYAEGKFRTNYTSFWPKKSFNKIVNLNLLNSKQFIENAFGDKKQLEKGNDYIAKSMKFYNKNYDDLMKESLLSRFDNVTYKTIKKENKIDQKDVEKFLKNFDNVGENI